MNQQSINCSLKITNIITVRKDKIEGHNSIDTSPVLMV